MDRRHSAIRISRRFSAAPDRVFDAWLDPAVADKWLFATASRPMAHVAIDARVNGAFHLVDRRGGEDLRYVGKYLEIARPRRLVFMLSAAHQSLAATRVAVEILPSETGCRLTLTHANVPADRIRHIEARWAGILYGLGATLECNSMVAA